MVGLLLARPGVFDQMRRGKPFWHRPPNIKIVKEAPQAIRLAEGLLGECQREVIGTIQEYAKDARIDWSPEGKKALEGECTKRVREKITGPKGLSDPIVKLIYDLKLKIVAMEISGLGNENAPPVGPGEAQ